MKDDIKSMNKMVKVISKLREETNHPKTRISGMTWLNVKWIWRNSKNPKEFKDWLRIELGW